MRSFPTLGFLSLVGALALVGCGDDDGDGGAGGTAGTGGGGSGGSAGSAGSAGGGAGGSAGTAGMGGGGMGGGGMTAACTGCVELAIPFSGPNQNVPYRFNHAPPGLDYSEAVITWNIMVETPNANLTVQPQLQNANPPGNFPGYFGAPSVALSAENFPAGMFTEVTLDMSTVPGPTFIGGADAGADAGGDGGLVVDPAVFDKTSVDALQIQFTSGAGVAGDFDAVIYIDSVTVENVDGFTGATFNAGTENFVLNTYDGDTAPDDTPAPVAR